MRSKKWWGYLLGLVLGAAGVVLGAAGVVAGNDVNAAPAPHHCDPANCTSVDMAGGDCARDVWCHSSSTSSSFWKCLPNPGNCADDPNTYGSTTCVGICQTDGGGTCRFTLGHCQ